MSQIRMFNIDFAKFIAILMVTGFHVWRFIGSPSSFWYGLDTWGFWKNGYMGCDLFFLISGYLSIQSWKRTEGIIFRERVKQYYKSKVIRIIPTYYIAIILWYFLVIKGIAVKPYGSIDILAHMFFIHTFNLSTFFSTSGVFWYLGVQIHFYLLFPLVVELCKRYNRIIIFLLSFIPLALVNVLLGKTENVVLYWNALTLMPTFLCGILLYEKDFILKQRLYLIPILTMCIGILFYEKITLLVGAFDRVLVGIAMGILLINLSHLIDKIPVAIKSTISDISLSSFSIYLYNYIIYSWHPILKWKTGLIIYVILVFGFGTMMYNIIEKPIQTLLTRTFRRKEFR